MSHFINIQKCSKQSWVNFCNRWKAIIVEKEKICSLHFTQEDFERNFKFGEFGRINLSQIKK